MCVNNINLAINFEYLLIDSYKELLLNEKDVAVIFMVKHFIEQGDVLVSADLLAIKMQLEASEIDEILEKLVNKGFLEYKKIKKKMVTSLDPLIRKINEIYQINFNKLLYKENNKKIFESIEKVKEFFEKSLNRKLLQIEKKLINEWIIDGFTIEICVKALEEAIKTQDTTFKNINEILLKWKEDFLD